LYSAEVRLPFRTLRDDSPFLAKRATAMFGGASSRPIQRLKPDPGLAIAPFDAAPKMKKILTRLVRSKCQW